MWAETGEFKTKTSFWCPGSSSETADSFIRFLSTEMHKTDGWIIIDRVFQEAQSRWTNCTTLHIATVITCLLPFLNNTFLGKA